MCETYKQLTVASCVQFLYPQQTVNQLSFVKAVMEHGECSVCNGKDELYGHFVLGQRVIECKFNQM